MLNLTALNFTGLLLIFCLRFSWEAMLHCFSAVNFDEKKDFNLPEAAELSQLYSVESETNQHCQGSFLGTCWNAPKDSWRCLDFSLRMTVFCLSVLKCPVQIESKCGPQRGDWMIYSSCGCSLDCHSEISSEGLTGVLYRYSQGRGCCFCCVVLGPNS